MSVEFDFIGPNDHPALLAISNPEVLAISRTSLTELGYKTHAVNTHEEFLTRFSQIQYQVVILEETFYAMSAWENISLTHLQEMAMNLRRHATVFLIGENFQSLNRMQAYRASVHAVVNRADLASLSPIIQQVVAENILFLQVYRDAQIRVAQGKA